MILSDVCELIVDCPHSTAKDEGEGYPLIRTPNIGKGRLLLEGVHRVSQEVYDKRNFRAVPQKNDLIFAREAPAGNVAIIKDEKVCLGQRTVLIRPNTDMINPDFLVYFLLSPKQQYGLLGTANGATVAHVNIPTIRNLPIEIPDIFIQNKIADILSNYDNLIENNQKQIKLLEEAAQRLYKEWFVDLHFPGYESSTITDGVPEGWFFTEFSDVFEYIRGKSYTSSELSDDEGTLMVNLKNIQSFGGYKRNAEKHFMGTYKREQTLDSGDVVMGITDMTQERRLVGHVALIPTLHCESTFSMDLIKLIPKITTRNYLYCAFRFGGYSSKISPLANGVNVLHLKPELMMNLKMLIPEKTIINAFDSKFEGIRLKIDALQKQIELSTEVRDRLLPKLMSREIEV